MKACTSFKMEHRHILHFFFVRGLTIILLTGGWIGCRGRAEWPLQSPCHTPRNLFLWGWAKEEVCSSKPETLNGLEQQIRDTFDAEVLDVLRRSDAYVFQVIASVR
jgi:hypothetical protein